MIGSNSRTLTKRMVASLFQALGLMALMLVAGCAAAPKAITVAVLRQPSEFEPQEAVWMSPEPDEPEFMQATADIVKALKPHVAIKMLVKDNAALSKTKEQLRKLGVDSDGIEFTVDALATFFIRDGTVYLTKGQGDLSVLDLKWSMYGLPGWCHRMYADDPKREAQCCSYLDVKQDEIDTLLARDAKASVIPSSLFLENATFEVNGKGVLIICETIALERNPGKTRDEIEVELRKIPGIRKVIWLGEGLAQDPLGIATIEGNYVGMGAGGHTDEFVRFADANTILLAWVDEDRIAEHPLNKINQERMQKNYDILSKAADQDGKPFRIIKIPMPKSIEKKVTLAPVTDEVSAMNVMYFPNSEGRKAGDEVIQVAAASYLNFIIANDLVLVPSFVEDGTPAAVQDQVRSAMETAFQGRKIQFIHAGALTWNGGGPHCATLSVPRSK